VRRQEVRVTVAVALADGDEVAGGNGVRRAVGEVVGVLEAGPVRMDVERHTVSVDGTTLALH